MSDTNGSGNRIQLFQGLDISMILMTLFLVGMFIFIGYSMNMREQMKKFIRLGISEQDLEELVELYNQIKSKGGTGTEEIDKEIAARQRDIEILKELIKKGDTELIARKMKELEDSLNNLRRKIDKPPIITLEDAAGFHFQSGSAELTVQFEDKLFSEIIPKIAEMGKMFGVDQIEVIGHTDAAHAGGGSNLDSCLIDYLRGGTTKLNAGDNTGLGMARAASVVRVLMSDSRLRNLKIVPYSAGQAVMTDNSLAPSYDSGGDERRRRIEIRMKRSTD